MATARAERERLRLERAKVRATRPHPLLDFIGGVFRPITSIWAFIGMIPLLFYILIGLACLLVLYLFVRLFVRK